MLIFQNLFALLLLVNVVYGASVRLSSRQTDRKSDNSDNASATSISKDAGPLGLDNAHCENVKLTIPVNVQLANFTNVDNSYSNQSYITRLWISPRLRPTGPPSMARVGTLGSS